MTFYYQVLDLPFTVVRMTIIFAGFGQATYFSAVCVQSIGLPRFQLQLNKETNSSLSENAIQLIIDGTSIDVSSIALDTNHTQSLDGVNETLLFKRSNVSVTVLTSSGISIEATAGNVSRNATANRNRLFGDNMGCAAVLELLNFSVVLFFFRCYCS